MLTADGSVAFVFQSAAIADLILLRQGKSGDNRKIRERKQGYLYKRLFLKTLMEKKHCHDIADQTTAGKGEQPGRPELC